MELIIRPYGPGDGARYLAIINQTREAPLTLEHLQKQDAHRDPSRFRYRLVGDTGQGLVGYGLLETHLMVPSGWYRGEVVVDRGSRRQGHGQRLAAALDLVVEEQRPKGIECWVRDNDPDSRRWAERQGFLVYTRRCDAILDLKSVDSPHRREPETPPGIRFFTMAETTGADSWERLHGLSARLMMQTPDLEGQPSLSFKEFCRVVRDNPRVTPAGVFVGAEGDRWVALSILFRMSADEFYTFFTGVDETYRGRGIAPAIKLRTIDYARRVGAQRMRTDVDERNIPMWAVNGRLGYRLTTGIWRMHRLLRN
jgi:GNAT superfamily N-acetyltransferase